MRASNAVVRQLPLSCGSPGVTSFTTARAILLQNQRELEQRAPTSILDEEVERKPRLSGGLYAMDGSGRLVERAQEPEEEDLRAAILRGAMQEQARVQRVRDGVQSGKEESSSGKFVSAKRWAQGSKKESETPITAFCRREGVMVESREKEGTKTILREKAGAIAERKETERVKAESREKTRAIAERKETERVKAEPKDKNETPPSRKRPSMSEEVIPATENDTQSTLFTDFTHRIVKVLVEKVQQDIAALPSREDVSGKQRVKCINALAAKYEASLKGYIPQRWVHCVALQQARLQEHAIIQPLCDVKEKQQDIRSLFGKKKESTCMSPVLKKYKAKYTEIYSTLMECIKEGRLPPFLPLFSIDGDAKVKNLLLMSKCRLSLAPFFSPEMMTAIVRHEVKVITQRTPKDEKKEEFVKSIHAQIEKAISKKQPFLLRDVHE